MGARPSWARLAVEAHEPLLEPFLAPMTDGRMADTEPRGDGRVGFTVRGGQDDLRSPHETVRGGMRAAEALQLLPLDHPKFQNPLLRATEPRYHVRSR